MKPRNLGLSQAYSAVVLMGIGITVIQTIPLPPQTLVWYRVCIALPALGLFALLTRQRLRVDRAHWLPLFWVSLLTGIHWVSLFISITFSTVAIGMISFYSFPIFSTLMEAALQKRKPLTRDVVISIITFCGVILLTPLTGASMEYLPGVLAGLLAAILWAGRIVIIHHCLRPVSGLQMMFWSMAIMLPLLSPALYKSPPPWQWEFATFRGVLILGLFVTAFCHTLLLSSLRHISATLVGQISPVQIVSASIAGWLFLHEPLTPRILIGGLLIASTGLMAALWFKNPPSGAAPAPVPPSRV